MLYARLRVAALSGILIFSIAVSVWAQVSRGTLTGIVADPSGAVVPGVAITVANTAAWRQE